MDWDCERNTLDPGKIVASGKNAYWKCHICGYRWSSRINSRVKGIGCPNCANLRRRNQTKCKKIIQLSLEGIALKEWMSLSEASRALNISAPQISLALRNKAKTAGGYKWEYKK